MVKTYYLLTKPGIIMGNAVTAVAGFALASRGGIDIGLLFSTLLGLSLIIASAAVFNNYIDRGIDRKMQRTKQRALASGVISPSEALIFATILGVAGALMLWFFTNALALFVAGTGFFVYVVLYGFWKRRSEYGTVVGSVSGATPPVVGYAAASGQVDAGAVILFLMLVLWQMPHFFAIAIYRLKDYQAAAIPVLPVKRGIARAKVSMLLYIVAFVLAAAALAVFGPAGKWYAGVSIILGISWLLIGIRGLKTDDDIRWARRMFALSLLVIVGVSSAITVEALLR